MEHGKTIAELLHWGTAQLRDTSASARLDSELLLAHVLGWSRARTLAEGRSLCAPAMATQFRLLIARRATGEPVAYMIGHREFFGLDMLVDPRVLVPRPETELLVEQALWRARRLEAPSIADVCTGSGCIAVALGYHLAGARIVATDLSSDALAVARMNVERHHVEQRVVLQQGDLLAALPGAVDILVCNPPYTILDRIDVGVWRHEPHLALDGGADGLWFYRRLLSQAPAYLRRGSALLLEIGADQGAAVATLAAWQYPGARIAVLPDLAGLDRVVTVDLVR